MPATESENRLARKLPGAWCNNYSRPRGGQRKNIHKTYLDLLNNLKFGASGPILRSNHGELSCIFALITGDNVAFNLRADHGLHGLVKNQLLDSTVLASVNYSFNPCSFNTEVLRFPLPDHSLHHSYVHPELSSSWLVLSLQRNCYVLVLTNLETT